MSMEDAPDEVLASFAERNAGYWGPTGWRDLILETHARLMAVNPGYKVAQIKEKFGGLRYYVNGPYVDGMVEIIREAEDRSYGICQGCGATDGVSMREHGWVATMCPACDANWRCFKSRGYKPWRGIGCSDPCACLAPEAEGLNLEGLGE